MIETKGVSDSVRIVGKSVTMVLHSAAVFAILTNAAKLGSRRAGNVCGGLLGRGKGATVEEILVRKGNKTRRGLRVGRNTAFLVVLSRIFKF